VTDFDPDLVPIRPAATVLLVSDTPVLKVLMMRRHANTVFAGGMWVFPGGAVDPEDAEIPTIGKVETVYPGDLPEADAASHRAYYVAAIRECFEEAGILLAQPDSKASQENAQPSSQDLYERERDRINEGALSFKTFLADHNLIADVGAIQPVARWITPLGSPKRFDARFFLAVSPPTQRSSHDAGELVDSAWMTPQEILEKFEQGEMAIMTPTLRMIQNLSAFTDTEDILNGLAASADYDRIRVDPDSRDLLLPGEPGYCEAADNIETGWVRLKPQ